MSMAAPELEQRCAIVTGASQGLGLEIAKRYLAAGAQLTICSRDEHMLNKALSDLNAIADPRQLVTAVRADVSNPDDVQRLLDVALKSMPRIDILVNNAGVIGPCGAVEDVDWREWVRTVEINLLGSVLVSRALLPHFKRAGKGKIIQLSGGGATNPLPMLSAYAVSKAAVIRFVETLAEETRRHCIDVNAIAPGALDTRILDQFIQAGPEKLGVEFHDRCVQLKQHGSVPLSRGADLAVFLGSARSDGITGKLLSAVWDPWESLPQHLEDLRGTDIYTLRRIVPKDRDLFWGEVD
jgi:NAD(P)-dependent dehydrogenase (short-subunit alcohol dehydrogenase family)